MDEDGSTDEDRASKYKRRYKDKKEKLEKVCAELQEAREENFRLYAEVERPSKHIY